MKLTIVTICRNASATIARTITSVRDEKRPGVEYVIVDGASTDGTQKVISSFPDVVDQLVSEPDAGIYDAMNKGLARARGEYIWFLNADDWLARDAVATVLQNLEAQDYLVGIALRVDDRQNVKGLFFPEVDDDGRVKDFLTKGTFFPHPALICRTELARRVGFRTNWRIAADYDFMIRFVDASRTSMYLPRILVHFQLGGISERAGVSELFSVQLANWETLVRTMAGPGDIRRYYRFLLERRRDPFYATEATTIRQLLALTPLPAVLKALLRLKFAIEGWRISWR